MSERHLCGGHHERESGIHRQKTIELHAAGSHTAKCRIKKGVWRCPCAAALDGIIRTTLRGGDVDTMHVDSTKERIKGRRRAQCRNVMLHVRVVLRQFGGLVSVAEYDEVPPNIVRAIV